MIRSPLKNGIHVKMCFADANKNAVEIPKGIVTENGFTLIKNTIRRRPDAV